tara:strand:+ start:74831 stop:77086 length:2256 start_codon:yes stop_codon:yes gene_type:complete
MSKNVLIVQHNTNSLEYINEGVSGKAKGDKYLLGGKFTEFDVKNRNERVYTWKKFQPALTELNERITSMGVYGEFDHPDTFDTSLKNASHMVKEAFYHEESNSVQGKIQLLTTSWGHQARSLVDDECPLFVSSRAAGVTEANGEVSLKKLFTYDIVADPGFASARMSSINESMGYKSDTNFRIYEIGDESKINELFEMNKDDLVTKNQLSEYSEYLVEQIASTKKKVNEALTKGNLEPKKLDELLSYYEGVQTDFSKITKYLDYLAVSLQSVVTENKALKESNTKLEKTTEKLVEHNDYLAENLEKTIEYSEYLAENVDKSIQYGEYLAENVDKAIQYGEYIAEQVDKSIDYSEYIAENLDKSIGFSDYLSENLNKSIEYTEYIAENVDTNIAYSEYIAEHLDDGLAYTDYIAEQVDKSIGYSKLIAEKLNEAKINENFFDGQTDTNFPMPLDAGIEEIPEEEEEDEFIDNELIDPTDDELLDTDLDVEGDDLEDDSNCHVVCDDDEEGGEVDDELLEPGDELIDDEESIEETPGLEDTELITDEEEEEEIFQESADTDETECNDDCDCGEDDCECCSKDTDLSKSIDKLIKEAKKRKASETNEHHFLKFLNKKQIDSFYALEQDDQEVVAAHINEKGKYYSTKDVLILINEALKSKEESLEDRLIRLMPDKLKDTWGKITESAKTSILSQSRLHPSASWSEENVEHFWLTRKFPILNETRKLVAQEDKLIQEDKLSNDAFGKIMEKFNRI